MVDGDDCEETDFKQIIQEFIFNIKQQQSFYSTIQPPYVDSTIISYEICVKSSRKLLLSFIESLLHYIKSSSCEFSVGKESFGTVKCAYDSFIEFVRDVSENYLNIKHEKEKKIGKNDQEDGRISPSNPFHSNFVDDNVDFDSNEIVIDKKLYELREEQNVFEKEFRRLRRKVSRILQKEKEFIRLKKMEKRRERKRRKRDDNEGGDSHAIGGGLEKEYVEVGEDGNDPEKMMQQLFNQYLNEGQWSWSDWHICMRRIYNINRDWFNMFLSNCTQMGLDWHKMYYGDVDAIKSNGGSINVRFDNRISNVGDADSGLHGERVLVGEGCVKDGDSVLFGNTDTGDDGDGYDEGRNELFCDSCNREFKSSRGFHIHLRGVRHIQNELDRVKKLSKGCMVGVRDDAGCVDLDLEVSEVPELTRNHVDVESINKPNNEDKYNRGYNNNDDGICGVGSTYNQKEHKCTIQHVINQCITSLIGLNYITEYQYILNTTNIRYSCDVCYQFINKPNIVRHLSSLQHRLLYLRKIYPQIYHFICCTQRRPVKMQKESKKKRRMRVGVGEMNLFYILDLCCDEIESYEGRRRLNVMCEVINSNNENVCVGSGSKYNTLSEEDKEAGELSSDDGEGEGGDTYVSDESKVTNMIATREAIDKEAGELSSDDGDGLAEGEETDNEERDRSDGEGIDAINNIMKEVDSRKLKYQSDKLCLGGFKFTVKSEESVFVNKHVKKIININGHMSDDIIRGVIREYIGVRKEDSDGKKMGIRMKDVKRNKNEEKSLNSALILINNNNNKLLKLDQTKCSININTEIINSIHKVKDYKTQNLMKSTKLKKHLEFLGTPTTTTPPPVSSNNNYAQEDKYGSYKASSTSLSSVPNTTMSMSTINPLILTPGMIEHASTSFIHNYSNPQSVYYPNMCHFPPHHPQHPSPSSFQFYSHYYPPRPSFYPPLPSRFPVRPRFNFTNQNQTNK